jgi:hypothetical protein
MGATYASILVKRIIFLLGKTRPQQFKNINANDNTIAANVNMKADNDNASVIFNAQAMASA